MTIILKNPNEDARLIDNPGRLKDIQALVGGNIEAIYPFDDLVAVICNEKSKLMQLDYNVGLLYDDKLYDILAGPILIVGLSSDSFAGLSPELSDKYLKMLNNPRKSFLYKGNSYPCMYDIN